MVRVNAVETIRTSMAYSLKQAAVASGKSKPTILRAIQSGKISAEKDKDGEWQIEPSELHRVFDPVPVHNGSDEAEWNDTYQAAPVEIALLRAELEHLRRRVSGMEIDREREHREASETIADLRERLDQSEQERREKDRQLTALLTDQRPGKRRRWLWRQRLAGGLKTE
jgi:predicted RNase H-like nuclease (RuvC/YqgF family)